MSNAFFYLVGQGLTYLLASWKWSFFLMLLLTLGSFVVWQVTVEVPMLLLGWLSAVCIPEYVLGVHFDCFSEKASRHLLIIAYTFEAFFYVLITLMTWFDDGIPAMWGMLLLMHLLLIMVLNTLEPHALRIQPFTRANGYFVVFAGLTALTDIAFLFVSVVTFGRAVHWITIVVFALFTFALTLMIRERISNAAFSSLVTNPNGIINGGSGNVVPPQIQISTSSLV